MGGARSTTPPILATMRGSRHRWRSRCPRRGRDRAAAIIEGLRKNAFSSTSYPNSGEIKNGVPTGTSTADNDADRSVGWLAAN
jgi:hypothetical protein